MANNPVTTEAAKELLLADHRYFGELFQRNEQIGETRVNWFIGIVTGATGGLVTLVAKSGELGPVRLRLIVMAALVALLVFGVITLFRVIQRNRTTDGFKKDLDNMRQVYRDHFDPEYVLMEYQPLRAPKKKSRDTKWSKWIQKRNLPRRLEWLLAGKWIKGSLGLRKFGGLSYTVAGLNSLLVAALAAAYFYPAPLEVNAPDLPQRLRPVFTAGVAVLLISFTLHWVFLTWQEWKGKRALRVGAVSHAGGVVFTREDDPAIKYLVVRPRIDDRQENKPATPEWVLPKGKVEDGEHHAQTAVREVLEETGVGARVIQLIGTVEYKIKGQNLKVKFYLMEKVFEAKSVERRISTWMPYSEAVVELTHDESRQVLKLAEHAREVTLGLRG